MILVVHFLLLIAEVSVNVSEPCRQWKRNKAVQLNQKQIACLLANGFMCTFPWQPYRDDHARLVPTINFAALYNTALPANVEN